MLIAKENAIKHKRTHNFNPNLRYIIYKHRSRKCVEKKYPPDLMVWIDISIIPAMLARNGSL